MAKSTRNSKSTRGKKIEFPASETVEDDKHPAYVAGIFGDNDQISTGAEEFTPSPIGPLPGPFPGPIQLPGPIPGPPTIPSPFPQPFPNPLPIPIPYTATKAGTSKPSRRARLPAIPNCSTPVSADFCNRAG